MTRREHVSEMMLHALIVARPALTANEMIGLIPAAVRIADALLEELAKIPSPSIQPSAKGGPDGPVRGGTAGDPDGHDNPPSLVSPATNGRLSDGCKRAAGDAVFDCEGRFPNDPPCPSPTSFDAVTKGRFCSVHIAVDEGTRREFHRLHGDRNRPAAKARRIAEALG